MFKNEAHPLPCLLASKQKTNPEFGQPVAEFSAAECGFGNLPHLRGLGNSANFGVALLGPFSSIWRGDSFAVEGLEEVWVCSKALVWRQYTVAIVLVTVTDIVPIAWFRFRVRAPSRPGQLFHPEQLISGKEDAAHLDLFETTY